METAAILVKDSNVTVRRATEVATVNYRCRIAIPTRAWTTESAQRLEAINTSVIAWKVLRALIAKRTSMIVMAIRANMGELASMEIISTNANAHLAMRAPLVRSESTSVWRNPAQTVAVVSIWITVLSVYVGAASPGSIVALTLMSVNQRPVKTVRLALIVSTLSNVNVPKAFRASIVMSRWIDSTKHQLRVIKKLK